MPRHHERSECYLIEVEERCGCWIEELTGFSASGDRGGTTLTGSVRDQAALYGVLRHLRDLGLTLVSLARVGETRCDEAADDRREG